MKQKMSFQQAVLDPNRPLSITPRQWMYSVQAQLSQQQQLVNKVSKRLASKTEDKLQIEGLQKIQIGIDQIVSGIKIVNQGILQCKNMDMIPNQRKIVNKVKQLLQQALIPYTSDIIEQLDKLQQQD